MITAGLDCGAKNVRAVILKDGAVVGKAMVPAGMDTAAAAEKAFAAALQEAALARDAVQKVVSRVAGMESSDDGIVRAPQDPSGLISHWPISPKV